MININFKTKNKPLLKKKTDYLSVQLIIVNVSAIDKLYFLMA